MTAGTETFPQKALLWNPIALIHYEMVFQQPLTIVMARDSSYPKGNVLRWTAECEVLQAIALVGISAKGPEALLDPAKLRLEVDGTIVVDDMPLLKLDEIRPADLFSKEGSSVLFQARTMDREPRGIFLVHGTHIKAILKGIEKEEAPGLKMTLKVATYAGIQDAAGGPKRHTFPDEAP